MPATKQEKWQEIANRGLQNRFDPEARARFDEAVKRGLITIPSNGTGESTRATDNANSLPWDFALKNHENKSSAFEGIKVNPDSSKPNNSFFRHETEEARKAPEIGADSIGGDVGRWNQFKALAKMSLSGSDEEQAKIAQQAFPGSEIRQDEGGSWMIDIPTDDKGLVTAAINKPGWSMRDLTTTVAQGAAFAPVGKITMGIGNLFARLGVAAGGSALTQAGLEKAQEAAGGDFDNSEVAIAGAMGPAVEAIGPVYRAGKRVVDRRAAKAIGAESQIPERTLENVRQAEEAGQALNVRTSKFQKTENPNQIAKADVAARSEAGSPEFDEFFRNQNQDISKAVDDKLLNKAASEESVNNAAERLRKTARDVLEDSKKARTEAANPRYVKAEQMGASIDMSPVVNQSMIIERKLGPKHPDLKRINQVVDNLTEGLEPAGKPSLERIHSTRKLIDYWINFDGTPKLSPDGADALKAMRDTINKRIDWAANSGDEAAKLFRQGDSIYENLSPEVKRLEDSFLGKIAGRKDTTMEGGISDIFNSNQVSMKQLKELKKLVEGKNPEAWAGAYRSYVEERLLKMKPDGLSRAGDTVKNLPAELERHLIGSDKQFQRMLELAPNEEVRKNLNFFRTVLSKAKIGRDINSKTYQRQATEAQMKSRLPSRLVNFRQSLTAFFDGVGWEESMRRLSGELLDADWKPAMEAAKKYGLESKQSDEALARIFDTASARATAQAARATSGNEQEEN